MSHFIATTLRFNKENKTIEIRGGDSNCVPRSNEWTEFESLKGFFLDVVANDCIDISRCKNKFAETVKVAAKEIQELHKQIYPKENTSILPYSLYSVSKTIEWDKEKTIKNVRQNTYSGANAERFKRQDDILIREWDEFEKHTYKLMGLFFEKLGIKQEFNKF